MPDAGEYAQRQFSNGLGRRAVLGCCADCGATLPDITALVCKNCRKKWETDERFLAREAGHRDRISDLFRGAKDGSMTFEKANRIYDRGHRKPKEVGAA